ncbi:uncharacterized protein LOC142333124 [Lycorma delicatula]|uniref:uncharacterized protein LOC142333124 n=1 Tax=Lycorma delicatula TaxID=130591 RepID=UPI003F510E96
MCEKLGRNSSWLEDTKLHIYNETHFAFTGTVVMNTEVNNNMWIRAIIQYKRKGSDKWNSIVSVNMKGCDVIERYVKKILTEMLANAGFKYKCPILKGVYHLKD